MLDLVLLSIHWLQTSMPPVISIDYKTTSDERLLTRRGTRWSIRTLFGEVCVTPA